MKLVRHLTAFVALTFIGPAVLATDTIRDPGQFFFHQSFGDLREELSAAKQEGQAVLMLMFENEDCPWCRKVRATMLNRSSVQDHFRKHFRILSIDTEGDTQVIGFDGKEISEKDFSLKLFRVRATPTFIFFDLEGKQLTKYIGSPRNIDELMWLSEFVLDGHYKNTNFDKYKRSKRAEGSSDKKS